MSCADFVEHKCPELVKKTCNANFLAEFKPTNEEFSISLKNRQNNEQNKKH